MKEALRLGVARLRLTPYMVETNVKEETLKACSAMSKTALVSHCPFRAVGCMLPWLSLSCKCLCALLLDPCLPDNPCFEDVECTRLSETQFECGKCPKWAHGDGINCEPVNEVRKTCCNFVLSEDVQQNLNVRA